MFSWPGGAWGVGAATVSWCRDTSKASRAELVGTGGQEDTGEREGTGEAAGEKSEKLIWAAAVGRFAKKARWKIFFANGLRKLAL